jgi:hypothetical protein
MSTAGLTEELRLVEEDLTRLQKTAADLRGIRLHRPALRARALAARGGRGQGGGRGGAGVATAESWSLRNPAGWSWRNSVTLVPASHRRRTARRSSSTSPPHTPYAPTPNACRSDSSRQSGRTGQRAQTAMAYAAWSRALATSRATGNQSSGSTREPAHRASRYTRPASSPSARSCGSRRTRCGLETTSTRLHLLPSGLSSGQLRRSIVSAAAAAPHPQSS